jgi:hypothetical protein
MIRERLVSIFNLYAAEERLQIGESATKASPAKTVKRACNISKRWHGEL